MFLSFYLFYCEYYYIKFSLSSTFHLFILSTFSDDVEGKRLHLICMMLLGIISDNIKGHCQVSFFWLVKKILRFISIYKNSFTKKEYFIIIYYYLLFLWLQIICCPGHRKYSSTYFNEIKVFSLVGQSIWITSYVFPRGKFLRQFI